MNAFYYNTDTPLCALVCSQHQRYRETAISKLGLEYLRELIRAGKIAHAIVVMTRWENHTQVVLKELDLLGLIEALKLVPPRRGMTGEYHWLNADGSSYDERQLMIPF